MSTCTCMNTKNLNKNNIHVNISWRYVKFYLRRFSHYERKGGTNKKSKLQKQPHDCKCLQQIC